MRFVAGLCCAVALIFTLPAVGGDWSRFRGPNGSGVADGSGLPAEIGPDKNKIWETAVPFGRSSPAIAGNRIYLTALDDGKLVTLALAADSGKLLWRRELERAHSAELHHDTDSSTSTPVTDGENVYVFFHEAGLISYDRNGKERWRHPLGPFRNFYGVASSPVLARGTLLMLCDQAEGSFLVALSAETGEERWRVARPARLESYSTPLFYPDAEAPKLVLVAGSRWVDAYDLESGKARWTLGGVGAGPVASPILAGNMLYVSAHNHAEDGWAEFGKITAEHDKNEDGELDRAEVAEAWLANHFGWLDADASGKISAEDWEQIRDEMTTESWGIHAIRLSPEGDDPEIVWSYRKNIDNIPSPLLYGDVFYKVKNGVVTSLDPASGEMIKRARLGDGSPKVYASPIAADGKIYFGTLDGELFVVEAGREWSVLSRTEMGEQIWATPAIADSRLYLRTKGKLYSFGSKTD